MRILADAYDDEGKAEFYNYLRGLDAMKSLAGENKTIILDKNSELVQILYGDN
jgi:membrane protease subunit HflC